MCTASIKAKPTHTLVQFYSYRQLLKPTNTMLCSTYKVPTVIKIHVTQGCQVFNTVLFEIFVSGTSAKKPAQTSSVSEA